MDLTSVYWDAYVSHDLYLAGHFPMQRVLNHPQFEAAQVLSPAPTPSRSPTTTQITASPSTPNHDPLINRRGDWFIYVGMVLLVIVLGFIVQAISKRIEYALLFAAALSLVLVLLLLLL